ncbi:MAG: DNA modification methylase [Chloroflexota bacterium]
MATIKTDQHNANKGTKRGKELLKQSLTELGGGRSILLDKDGNVIAGNKTFEGAQEAGMQVRIVKAERGELIAVQRDDLILDDPTGEARRLAYLDNRVSELDLNWDAEQIAEDARAGLDFDGAGFLEGELREMLDQAGVEDEAGKDPGDQSDKGDELVRKWGVQEGQVWQLGSHRLMCGDSTNPLNVERLLGQERATLTFTSPPYWVGKDYETQTSEVEIDAFIEEMSKAIHAVTRLDESRIVINTGTGFSTALDKKAKRHVFLLVDKWTNALHRLGWNLRHVRHWIKEGQLMATSPKTDIIDQHNEFLATYEHADGEPKRFEDVFDDSDVSLLMTFYHTQGKQRGTEWTGASWALRSYWDDIKGTARANGHTAAFPIELPLRHLMLYSRKGEIVFEPFCGSGTTLIACEVMKRVCRGVELNPVYVAATLERWHILTGKEPVICEQ